MDTMSLTSSFSHMNLHPQQAGEEQCVRAKSAILPCSRHFPGKNTGVHCHICRGSSGPRIAPLSLASPTLQVDSLPLHH